MCVPSNFDDETRSIDVPLMLSSGSKEYKKNEHLSKSNGGETWSLVTCGLPFAVCRKRDSKSHCCMVILMTCMYKCTLFSFLDVQSPKGGSPIEGK